MKKSKIEIIEPNSSNTTEIGFINWVIKNNIGKLSDKIRPKTEYEFQNYLRNIYSCRPKVIKAEGKIICVFWASDIEQDLNCFFHVHLNTFEGRGLKTFHLFRKYNIGDIIVDEIFKDNKVNSILVFFPEWLEERNIVKDGKKTPVKTAMHKLLDIAGFKYIGLIRDWEKYHGRNKAIFQYQISRGFFYKWKSIEKAFKKGFSIEEISKNYDVKCDIIKKVATNKKWSK